jgi:5-methyltetrahydrofolate--homocysteine methyltransferase
LLEELEEVKNPETPEEKALDVDRIVKEYRNHCRTHVMLAEAFPYLNMNMSPLSVVLMALYLGCEPVFEWNTVWVSELEMSDWRDVVPLEYDPDSPWWKRHVKMICRAKELVGDDFPIEIVPLARMLAQQSVTRWVDP